MRLSSLTQQEVRVTLARRSGSSGRPPATGHRPPQQQTQQTQQTQQAQQADPPPPPREEPRTRSVTGGEVLDPWAR
ncbi:MAG: hypothetical protein M5U28_08835 [Sandaracinaceae bacterium]|nr:hypothetical protein [Sandaracinaceae bacterium]